MDTRILGGVIFVVGSSIIVCAEPNPALNAAGFPITTIVRASTNSNGAQANGSSSGQAISADGRYVVFASSARNLVGAATTGVQIFRKDLKTQNIALVSANAQGKPGTGSSDSPTISADGRHVAFESAATNLVAGDQNGRRDVFVKDMVNGSIVRATTSKSNVEGNGNSGSPFISGNGRYVVFVSTASNLVDGGSTKQQVFRKDLKTGAVVLVSAGEDDTPGDSTSSSPSVSTDGRFVAFASLASNLVAHDTNGVRDIFVKDLKTAVIKRASERGNGQQANSASDTPSLSPDGGHVAFVSKASNLVNSCKNGKTAVFVVQVSTGAITCASTDVHGHAANGSSTEPRLSISGRYVAFQSTATNLVPGDSNGKAGIFVKDLTTGAVHVKRASVNSAGKQATGAATSPSLSSDGQFVAFSSVAKNLVANDTNGVSDVFVTASSVFTHSPTQIARVSERKKPAKSASRAVVQAAGRSGLNGTAISASGRYVAFTSQAANLTATLCNTGIYVKDLTTESITCASDSPDSQVSPSISPDGRYVALVGTPNADASDDCGTNPKEFVYRKDLVSGELVCASTNAQKVRANNNSFQTSMSADGRFVAFSSLATNLVSGDHDNVADVFIKDIVTGAVSFGGEGSLPALSADGEKIAMFPRGGGIKLKDLNTQVTTTVADAIDVDGCFSMTPDARFFLFQRNAGHYQMYWKDMASGAEILVSADPGGVPGNDHSYLALPSAPGSLGSCNQSISSDGRYVVFASAADNLVPNDLNGSADIFVKDTLTGAIARVSVNADGTEGIDHSFGAAISSDGRLITFGSFSDNLVPGDTQLCGDTNCPDIFITPNPLLQ